MDYSTYKKMFDYVGRIEKARSHKYIDRKPKKTGKGWYYIYAETFKKPFNALLEIFGIKEERIRNDYEEDNIQKDFGIDKNLYASHVLEFFLNRDKWHNLFSKKLNRDKYKKPVKQADVERKAAERKATKKKEETVTQKTQQLNRSLMFRIWKRYTPESDKLLGQDRQFNCEENPAIERPIINKITGVDKLTEEDFTSPKRSVLLTPMTNDFYEKTGVEKKEILIKKNIFEKNKNHHTEIKTVEENRKIIENALYGNNIAMLCKPNEKPNYWTVVKSDDYYYLAVIDTDSSKEYHEIVGWRRISDKGFENMKKQVEKEGGQFLITGGNHTVDRSADLSDLQSNQKESISQEESTVNEVKPQTDSEIKKEQEKTKRARKEAGLPDINENALDARISAIEDLSWNPNSENYRYKDTGYIAGARKEQAVFLLKQAGRNKKRLRETDIDWVGVEENERAAKEVIVKSNIFGQVDWAALKEVGMTGGAAFLIDRIYSQIGKEPTKDTPEARKNYVIAVNGLRDRLETAKTVQDVENILNEIKDEMNGRFFSVRNTPEYQRRLTEITEIRRKIREIKAKDKELLDAYYKQSQREDVEINELQRQWLKEHKVIKWNQKYFYGVVNNMPLELKSKYDNYCEKINVENRKESKQLDTELEKFREENLSVRNANNKYTFADGCYTYIDYEIERELYDKEQELKAYEGKEGAKVLLQNPLYKAWIELGDKFDVIVRNDWKSKTFYNHKADARRGIYDDWEWANKEKIEVTRKGIERKVQFEFKVASNYERKGGRDISVESTEQLKRTFSLRDVQSGNWVLNDPESAKWHVDRIAEGFADLTDVTGISENLISLNGRLAMAIGARGKGGAKSANAHYEPVERVINITKMKGGGSLGHEWFHAFDNLIMEAMGSTKGVKGFYMTNKFAHLKQKDKELLVSYLEETNPYFKARYKKELDKKNIQIPEKPKEIFQIKVANAFDNLTKVMTTGETTVKEKIIYSQRDYELAILNIKANAKTNIGRKLFEAGNIDNAMNILNEIYKDRKSKSKTSWYKIAAAFYLGSPNGGKKEAFVDMGTRKSSFFKEAIALDNGTENYWSTTHEMAARAFSAYIDDKLRSQDRFNDYLANYTENKYYKTPFGESKPYPEGEERKRINAAFDELFKIIRNENAIRKALQFEESDHPRAENGRFTSKSNQNAKRKFSDLTELEKRQKALRIRNVIVSSIRKNSVPYNKNLSFAENAKNWIRNNPQGNAKTSIGKIIINSKYVEKDLYHGIKDGLYLKLQTLPAVKDILEKGTYLGYEKDFEGKPIDNHYFAGKIEYGNDEKIVFCRVRENAGDESRFYVHEVFTEDEIKKEAFQASVVDGSLPRLTGKPLKEAPKRTSNDGSLRLTGKPLYKFILQTIFNVNSDEEIKKAIYNESDHPRAENGRFTKKFALDKDCIFAGNETSHINNKFNEELEEYKKGNLPSNHVFKLGKPNEILVKVGFPANDDIELRANQLQIKLDKHDFTVDDIKNLPEMLKKPVAVFKYGDEKKAQNIIVELQKDDKNFLVGVHFKNQGMDVSNIRGVFNKDNHEWLNWITKGKALYLNTKKLQSLINQQRTNLADVEYLDLESIEDLLKKNSGVKDLFLTPQMNVEIRKSRFINRLNYEFCKLVEYERRKKAYSEKLGRGYIEYCKKYHPELV